MSQELVQTTPLKPGQKLPSSQISDAKESKAKSYSEYRDIACYLLIADIFIMSGDFKNADRYFQKAADLGNSYAQNELSYKDTWLYDYPKKLPMIPVFFENYCRKSTKTLSPRGCWMLARLYESVDPNKANEYCKKAFGEKYIRADVDLTLIHMFSDPGKKTHTELMEYYNKINKIDYAPILFKCGFFFETVLKETQYGALFYEAAAKQGHPRAHFELGQHYKKGCAENDLSKALEHLKEAQNGYERLLEILNLDRGILNNQAILQNKLNFESAKKLVASELSKVEQLIAEQSSVPVKTAKAKKGARQNARKKQSSTSTNTNNVASAASNAVTLPVIPQDLTNTESKNATPKSNELEELSSANASGQFVKNQNNTIDITTTSIAPAEKKSTSPAKKEESSTAKKAPTTPAELPESQSAINPDQKKEKVASNRKPKAEDRAANNSVAVVHQKPVKKKKASTNNALQEQILVTLVPSITTSNAAVAAVDTAEKKASPAVSTTAKASHKIKGKIASNPPVVTSQSLNPKKSNQTPIAPNIVSVTKLAAPAAKKAAPPTAETKQTIPKANPKSESVAVSNLSTTPKQNINQRSKTSANVSNKPAINTASTSASISNRSVNYFSSSSRNNDQSTAALTADRQTAITTPPAKTSPAPKQEGKMSYADLFKKIGHPTTGSAAGSFAAEIKKNNSNTQNVAQSVPATPISAVALPDNKLDKNLVAAPNFTPINREEKVVTAPTFAQQPMAVPPQASFAYPSSVNSAATYEYEQIPPAPMDSVPTVMSTPVDPYMQAMLNAYFQAGRNSVAASIAFTAGQYYELAAWDVLYATQPGLPPLSQIPTQTSVQHPDPTWSSFQHHSVANIALPAYGAYGIPMTPPLPAYGNNSSAFLYHGTHPNPLSSGGNLTSPSNATENGNTF